FKISGHLPVLHASISDTKYKSLMRIIDVAIPKFEESNLSLPEKEITKHSVPDNRRSFSEHRPSNAFQFLPPQDLVIPDDSDDGTDEFEEASDGIADNSPSLQQKSFEFQFTV